MTKEQLKQQRALRQEYIQYLYYSNHMDRCVSYESFAKQYKNTPFSILEGEYKFLKTIDEKKGLKYEHRRKRKTH